MPEAVDIVAAVHQGVERAEEDLKMATVCSRLKQGCPVRGVAVHVQQCIEKYLKGLLTWRQIRFPKTHNLAALVELLPDRLSPLLRADELDRLTEYATVARYPGDYPPLSRDEAAAAVRTPRRVRQRIRQFLPKEALTTKKGEL